MDKSRGGTQSTEGQAEKLEELLMELPAGHIQGFDKIFAELRIAAYRWDLWGVAYLLCGGCSDDSFDYFTAWIIGKGESFYNEALANPESIAEKVTEDDSPDGEPLMYAAPKAYEAQTGDAMPVGNIHLPAEPIGIKWEEEALPGLFPIAYAKQGICG